MLNGPHSLHPCSLDPGGKHQTLLVLPEPHRPVADVDAALMQQVLDVPKRQRVTDVQHNRQADDLGARFEVQEGARRVVSRG